MNKLLIIQAFAALLCISTTAEISIPMDEAVQTTAEADSETESEHEEKKEDSKEKNTNLLALKIPKGNAFWLKNGLAADCKANWKPPLIDFHTPPPELK